MICGKLWSAQLERFVLVINLFSQKSLFVTLLTILFPAGEVVRFEYDGDNFDNVIDRIGTSPLPPYINRDADSNDKKRYQTVYASQRGAVAAPTAGLHFTDGLIKKVKDKGTKVENITLHIGWHI